jgi:hypothetical protein
MGSTFKVAKKKEKRTATEKKRNVKYLSWRAKLLFY